MLESTYSLGKPQSEKVPPLVVRPLREGGGVKGRTTKEKERFEALKLKRNPMTTKLEGG